MFCVLQDGGLERHEYITAGDKDLDPVWDKMCDFATIDVFAFSLREGMITEAVYTQDEEASLKEQKDELKENWLEQIYGASSKQLSIVWIEKVAQNDASWAFSAAELRSRLFALAEIREHHCN